LNISKNNRRLNSPFVTLPKNLRQFLYLLNEESGQMIFNKIEIDGSNTQPILLCVKMEKDGFEIDNDFMSLCLDGKIYDSIAEEMGETRDWVKERFMDTLLYTKANSEYLLSIKNPNKKNVDRIKFINYFKDRFTLFYNRVKNEKKRKSGDKTGTNKNNPGGSKLAIEIQRMEADLWIHSLLKEIPEKVICITIHDSIMIFNPSNEIVEFVKAKIIELGKKMYRVELPLKIV
jgi:hypothetical protein